MTIHINDAPLCLWSRHLSHRVKTPLASSLQHLSWQTSRPTPSLASLLCQGSRFQLARKLLPGLGMGQGTKSRSSCKLWRHSWKYLLSNACRISKLPVRTFIQDREPFALNVEGIHCYPLVGWDGEAGVKNPDQSSDLFPGYCAHNRVTFPLWHRPYMLLFEARNYPSLVSTIDNECL